ncbi:type II toxin-antitoxin system RelE/ParE family toxin [Aureimonas populi]|uniref:Type II toxin-antitoxin system RelE/ParE family toxin n=1 Tax=Aureimonas populi TaxID=1701758 RepID=A0ABW5CKB8_9HYPH
MQWTLPALRHLDEIQDYIAERSHDAAYRLTAQIIEKTTDLLSANPSIGRRAAS